MFSREDTGVRQTGVLGCGEKAMSYIELGGVCTDPLY